jgi:hypothetical protein
MYSYIKRNVNFNIFCSYKYICTYINWYAENKLFCVIKNMKPMPVVFSSDHGIKPYLKRHKYLFWGTFVLLEAKCDI